MLKSKRSHFLNVFSSTSSANRLKIPVGFKTNLEGRISGSVLLKGPSGYGWVVELVQKNDDLFFDEGWADFVRDHSLECGDFLVFRYDGDLVFNVKVFDQSLCEKEVAFHCKCSQGGSEFDGIVGQKRDREDGGVSLDQDCEGVLKRSRGSSSESDDNEYFGHEPMLATKTCEGLTSCDENHEGSILKTTVEDDDLNLHGSGCIPMVGEFEEKKVAQSFNSHFPFFVRIMKRFNVSGSYTLNIPYQFAMEHLPKCKTEIVLRNLKGACWTVNSVPTTRVHTSHTLCGGWLGFVRSNEIKVGDICIFEFVRKFELCVHILRVGKEDPDRQRGKAVPNVLIDRSDATISKKFVKNSSKVHSEPKKVQMCDNKGSKMLDKWKYAASFALCSLSRSGNDKQEAAIGGLRMMLALDEEKAARSFASGFPNFVRIMRKFNISGSYTLLSLQKHIRGLGIL
ncbi:B3 domain-containing protein Os11g0197600-like isoform X2 [Durio zibethinus]|uniref:B3 domain-containing protein Os11g0197600-like isoform X2 n=1 Tax=Durio zibethinus TaxID=66656 RepID=A0A6P6AVK4_DURZI|nr:B3 domain-containing protein Os11g0197600-like isoform X2 [Durio zibethinus]